MTISPDFDPVSSLIGGLMLGLAAMLLFVLRGDVAGINGMVTGIIKPIKGELGWRVLFILGLLIGGLSYQLEGGALTQLQPVASTKAIALGGILVGLGATWGSGCTSGHGICGISRLSSRSITATITFMIAAIATVYVSQHQAGGFL